MQGQILRPFTNSTHSALDFRVKNQKLRPLVYSTNLALDCRVQKLTLRSYTDSTTLALDCRVPNGHRRMQNSRAKQSLPPETVTAVQNGLSIFLIILYFHNR